MRVPGILYVRFPGRGHRRFAENIFCHFALKVPHVFWMLSFETLSGHPLRLSREDRAWVFKLARSGFESQFCGFSGMLSLGLSSASCVKIKYEEVKELQAGQGSGGTSKHTLPGEAILYRSFLATCSAPHVSLAHSLLGPRGVRACPTLLLSLNPHGPTVPSTPPSSRSLGTVHL